MTEAGEADREFRLRRPLALKSGRSARFSLLVTAWNIMGGFMGYAINSIAMPMIGGTTTWLGPLLIGTVQQVATVTLSSELNLLIVGVLLVFFVIAAPEGIVGLLRKWRKAVDDR